MSELITYPKTPFLSHSVNFFWTLALISSLSIIFHLIKFSCFQFDLFTQCLLLPLSWKTVKFLNFVKKIHFLGTFSWFFSFFRVNGPHFLNHLEKKLRFFIRFIFHLMLSHLVSANFFSTPFFIPCHSRSKKSMWRKLSEKEHGISFSLDTLCGIYNREEWSSPFTSCLCWAWRREGHIWRSMVTVDL